MVVKDLLILGAGGVGMEIVEIAHAMNLVQKTWNILGFLDDNLELQGKKVHGYPVLGTIDQYQQFPNAYFSSSIGHPDKRFIRRKVRERIAVPNDRFATLVHPKAVVFPSAQIGPGCVVNSGCQIGTAVRLGHDVFVTYCSSLAHECEIGDHTVIASGVVLSGEVKVGSEVYLGAGVVVSHHVQIGSNTLVGLGSVISENVPANSKLVQNNRSFIFPDAEKSV